MSAVTDTLHALNPWWRSATAGLPPPAPVSYRRHAFDRVRHRVHSASQRGVLLYGQRRVGKTELCRQLFEEELAASRRGTGLPASQLAYVALDDARFREVVTVADLLAAWDTVRDRAAPAFVVVDEAHHLSEEGGRSWANQIKGLVDEGPVRLLATGSSARILREGSADAPGRWTLEALEPLSFREFREIQRGGRPPSGAPSELLTSLDEYLVRGGYPGHVLLGSREEACAATQERTRQVLDLEIQGSRDTDRIQRLYAVLLESSGAHIDVSKLAQALGHSRPTILDWLGQLEQAVLIHRVPRLAADTLRELRGAEKIYAPDPGLVSAFARTATPLEDEKVRGRLRECAVLRLLREFAWRAPRHQARIACLQGSTGSRAEGEVDFVVEHEDELVLVEVAGSSGLTEKRSFVESAARSLASRRQHATVRGFVLHAGVNRTEGRVPLHSLPDFLDRGSQIQSEEGLAYLRSLAEPITA